MSYYKSRSYSKKKYYKKPYYYKTYNSQRYNDPQEDFAFLGALGIVFIGFWILKIYKEQPILFYGAIALVVLCGIFVLWFLKKSFDKKMMKKRSLQDMKNMEWREFEKFIAFVFKKKGYSTQIGKGRNDGGIDVLAKKDGVTYVIQCKKWNNYKIGVKDLREFVGTIDDVGENAMGVYITTSRLTPEAEAYKNRMKHKFEVWDAYSLEEYVRMFTGMQEVSHIREETLEAEHKIICEKCGSPMILREAHKGEHQGEKFYGCSNFPKCRHIVNISQ